MSLAKEGENNEFSFNIGGSHESQETQRSASMSKLISSAISTIDLKPHMQDGKLDKNHIVNEILDKTADLEITPILNIQFN